jgi:hypothetical protein
MTSTTEHLLSKQDAVLGNIIQQVSKPMAVAVPIAIGMGATQVVGCSVFIGV